MGPSPHSLSTFPGILTRAAQRRQPGSTEGVATYLPQCLPLLTCPAELTCVILQTAPDGVAGAESHTPWPPEDFLS